MTRLSLFFLGAAGSLLILVLMSRDIRAEELEELVVLGSRIPTDSRSGVEVVDRDALESFGAASLAQVLTQFGGIHVTNAGRGSINSLFLRGADPNFTQVQINGIPVNDPMNSRGGAYDIGSLSASAIQRIEILPAAASALYGSQALAGVINITTREAASASELSVSLDSRGGYGFGFLTGGANAGITGFVDAPGAQVDGSHYRASGVAARTAIDISDNARLGVSGRYQDSDARAFPDDSGGGLYAVSRELENRQPTEGQLDFSYTRALPRSSQIVVQGSYFLHDEDIFTPAVAPGPRDPAGLPITVTDNEYRRRGLKLQYLSPQNRKHRFAGGIERQEESGSTVGTLDFGFFELPSSFDLDRNTTSAFAEWRWTPTENFRTVAGGRLDRTETGDRFSPRINIERSFSGLSHTFHASWGEGYKLPSFYALGHPVIGNPDLIDEASNSYEIGYRHSTSQTLFAIALFSNEFENLVDFDAGPPPRLVNRDRVSIEGFEARLHASVAGNLSLDTHYAFVNADIEGTAIELRNRPEHRAQLGITWRPRPGVRFGLSSRFVGKQFDSSIPTGDMELSSYVVTDAVAHWKPNDRLTTTIGIDNLFDENYEDSIGNEVKGLTLVLYTSYRLGAND